MKNEPIFLLLQVGGNRISMEAPFKKHKYIREPLAKLEYESTLMGYQRYPLDN